MSNLKNAKKEFKKSMIIFFMIILIFIGVIVVIFLLPTSEHLKVPLAMLVSLILLIFLILYRPRILYYLESIMFFRLLENQGPLLKNVQPLESEIGRAHV